MSEKKPAHAQVVEAIRATVSSIEQHGNPAVDNNDEVWIFTANFLGGKLSAQLEMITGFFIPEKHREEVVNALREIKESTSYKGISEYMHEGVFREILSSPAKAKETLSSKCSICGALLAPNEGVEGEKGLVCEIGCLP
jgi:hypothetical protein